MNESCDCCAGVTAITPVTVANRPGLTALAYRVGTHGSFLLTMEARLASTAYPALAGLTTRQRDDPSLALLDAWATVADVLTFYQERIAREGYLRTAIERRSVLELARLVGYALRPGVAASVYLAFTLEAHRAVLIPAGSRAQSVPAPGELPQSFETADPLDARAAWNTLGPRLARPQNITPATLVIYFEGIATNLKANDPLVFDFGVAGQTPRYVQTVEPQAIANRTRVTLRPPGDPTGMREVAFAPPPPGAAVQAVVEQYGTPPLLRLRAETRTANRVVRLLQDVHASLSAGAPTPGTTRLLDEIRSARDQAQTGRQALLADWLGRMVADLEQAVQPAPTALDRALDGESDPGADSAPAGPVLARLIGPLQRPPTIPPANTQRLQRDPKDLFAAAADTVPQLLATMTRLPQTVLYGAWANAERNTPSPLVSIAAPRVKATPFGSTVPPRTIYDDKGRPAGYEDWPLAGSLAVGVQLSSGTSAVVLVRRGADVESADVGSGNRTFDLGGLHVHTHLGTGFNLTAEFFQGSPITPTHTITVAPDLASPLGVKAVQLNVTIDADPPRLVSPGQTLVYTRDNRTITIQFRSSGISDAGLSHNDEIRSAALTSGLFLSVEVAAPVPPTGLNVLPLDGLYDQITPQSWVVIARAGQPTPIIAQVQQVETVSKSAYGITARVTQLTLDRNWLEATDLTVAALHGITVYAQSDGLYTAPPPPADTVSRALLAGGVAPVRVEAVSAATPPARGLALEPIDPIGEPIAGSEIELDDLYGGLQSGRWLIVAGERIDNDLPPGTRASELVMLANVTQSPQSNLPGDRVHSTLHLATALSYTYKRDTVTIYGNVVKATHGETRNEVLGSGDGSKPLQAFPLRQAPLTYLPAVNPTGATSTLQVRVNDVLWHETDTLAGLERTDRQYITQTDDANKTTVIFGNGQEGARLPTGVENVKATYRTGIGQPGNVAAGQISLLVTRPLGVRGVNNPLPATGGADREDRDQARRNAPLGVLALDRLVGVQDYADFARTFAGIGKASAARLSDGRRQLVHLTIAGANDIPIADTSDLYRSLLQALGTAGDPYQPVQVVTRDLLLLVIVANVRVLPDYIWEAVGPEVRRALLDTFSFARRDLGQDAFASEAIRAIQEVRGVAYVDLDRFDAVDQARVTASLGQPGGLAAGLQLRSRIVVNLAEPDRSVAGAQRGAIRPAQLAYLSPSVADTLILNPLS